MPVAGDIGEDEAESSSGRQGYVDTIHAGFHPRKRSLYIPTMKSIFSCTLNSPRRTSGIHTTSRKRHGGKAHPDSRC